MPAQVDEVLLQSEAFGPLASRPDRSAVIKAGHHSVEIFDYIVDGQHPKAELLGLKLLWNREVAWNEGNGECRCIHGRVLWVERVNQLAT